MNNIHKHINSNGTIYYSTKQLGETIYSFTEDFEDIWTQDDQDIEDSRNTNTNKASSDI